MRKIVGVLIVIVGVTIGSVRAQCTLLDKDMSAIAIAFEKTEKVDVDAQVKDGVIFRLRNNTTCDANILTGDVDDRYKPLPPKPTVMQILKREIEWELADDAFVPSIFFRYGTINGTTAPRGGCTYFNFTLRAGRSLRFGVHLEHFLPKKFNSHIEVPFTFAWESGSVQPLIEANGNNHFATFSNYNLPDGVQDRIR